MTVEKVESEIYLNCVVTKQNRLNHRDSGNKIVLSNKTVTFICRILINKCFINAQNSSAHRDL